MSTGRERTVAAKAPRDLRLDFFRGLAMFIILLAHTPGNTWTLWIPARFGFSDATEIFVFCSGFASALAFGALFVKSGWAMGTARVAFRVWQVYWAHLSVIFATALLMAAIDASGLGPEGMVYKEWWPVSGIFDDAGTALLGFFTLTNVPGLFDILPMYLVILALIPVAMTAHHFGGVPAVFGLVAALWLAAQLALWHRALGAEETHALGAVLADVGGLFSFLLFPSNPWGEGVWFFNPFGWQLIFFTGFAFGMRWLPAPPVRRGLILLAAGYLILSVPFAWFRILDGSYLPYEWPLRIWLADARDFIGPLINKSGVGLIRYLHFLAFAYLAWATVGPSGARLLSGWRAPDAAEAPVLAVCGVVALATLPYAYVEEVKLLFPALDAAMLSYMEPRGLIPPWQRLGLIQFLHFLALVPLVWWAVGAAWRARVMRDWFLAAVPVIRKVGTQSLAVFLMSLVLSRFNGFALDALGRNVFTTAAVNLWGFGVLIGTAYLVGWFKAEPWRNARKPQVNAPQGPKVANPGPAE